MRDVRRRNRATAGTPAVALLAVALVAQGIVGCSAPDGDYFGPDEPTWVRIPVTTGDPAYVGIALLLAHDGDVVTVESVEFAAIEGDAVIEPLAAVLHGETRLIGALAASAVGTSVDLSAYAPARGTRFAADDGPVALAARISGSAPIHGFGSVTVRFRVEGERDIRVDVIPFRATVCSGESMAAAVEVCRPIQDQMRSRGV